MTLLLVALAASGAGYLCVALSRAHGHDQSIRDVIREDVVGIKGYATGWSRAVRRSPEVNQRDLFSIPGRDDEARVNGERFALPAYRNGQRGGVEVDPLPSGAGRVRNPNAPCWLCGGLKSEDHKCP